MNKTILVTGATGLIGSNLIDSLLKIQGVHIIAIGRSKEKLKSCFNKYYSSDNLILCEHDISEALPVTEKIDIIFHAAGPMERNVIMNEPVNVLTPNIIGTINCLEFLKRQKSNGYEGKLICFSSVTVYGNNSSTDICVSEDDTDVTEKISSLSSVYSQSKRMQEVIGGAYYRQFGVNVLFARFSTVYGYTRFMPDTAFFEFIKKAIHGEDIFIQNGMAPKRDNIYIKDAVNALLLLAERGGSGEAYNISSNGDLDNYVAIDEIARCIVDYSNKKFRSNRIQPVHVICPQNSEKQRKAGIRLNNTKIKQLGWEINYSFSAGIAETIDLFYNQERESKK